MIVSILTAAAVSVVGMIIIGTFISSILGLSAGVNWVMQTATMFAIASASVWTAPQTIVLVAVPTIVHVALLLVHKRRVRKIKSGEYGNMRMWSYEFFEDGDEDFIRAQTALPPEDVMEVGIIADSKEELREEMLERYEEKSEDLSTSANN